MGFRRKISGENVSDGKFSGGKGGFRKPFPPKKKIISGNFPSETEFPLDAVKNMYRMDRVKDYKL